MEKNLGKYKPLKLWEDVLNRFFSLKIGFILRGP